MRVNWHRRGVSLVLVSLFLAIIAEVWFEVLVMAGSNLLPSDLPSALWWHTVVMPGINLTILAATGIVGFAGIIAIELDRSQRAVAARRVWDRPALVVLVAGLAAVAFFVSGIVAAFFFVPGLFVLVRGIRAVAGFALTASVGLYLLWTAERIGSTRNRRLGRVAVVFAMISAAIGTVLGQAVLVLESPDALSNRFMIDLTISLGFVGFVLGLLSLGIWIGVYGRIVARSRDRGRSASALDGA